MTQKPWMPPGPVAARFYADRSYLSLIQGPVGSAKTSTAFAKIILWASLQPPSPIDGIKRSKWRVLRDTYRNVKTTTLQTWHKFFPPQVGEFAGGGPNDPARHVIRMTHPDGRVDWELVMEFMGVGELNAEEVFSSWEGTGIYFNEVNLIPEEVFVQGIARPGRYPGQPHGITPVFGILADFNAPAVTNYVYKLLSKIQAGRFDAMLRDYDIAPEDLLTEFHTGLASYYRQPGGRAPGAENLQNLPKGYYKRIVGSYALVGREDLIKTKVDNQFGADRSGKPVYGKVWRDDDHVASEILRPTPGLAILVCADQGLNPAGLILQEQADGAIWCLDELVPPPDVQWFAEDFAEALNALLRRRYFEWEPEDINGTYDLAGDQRTAAAIGRQLTSWAAVVKANTRFRWRAASTNDISVRLAAVRQPLVRRGGFLLSPHCEVTREGFNSGYCFPKKSVEGEYGETPKKNRFSNPHDALQYGCMALGQHEIALGRTASRSTAPVMAPHEFKVL